jgi:beta-phosphoglucomutase-like phosphatase (HAD superfamily)
MLLLIKLKQEMSVPFRAVIFDLDGTLLDTLEYIGNAVNHILIEEGYPAHHIEMYRCGKTVLVP